MLSQRNKYNEKTIKKALYKTTAILDSVSTDLPKTDIANRAANALIEYYKDAIPSNNTSFLHECNIIQNLSRQIKEAHDATIAQSISDANNNINSYLANFGYNVNDRALSTTTAVNMTQNNANTSNQELAEDTTTTVATNGTVAIDEIENFTYNREIESIKGHYYKQGKIRFRCGLKGYDITITQEIREIIRHEQAISEYIRKQTNRAIGTMINRAPILAKFLKKQTKEKRPS